MRLRPQAPVEPVHLNVGDRIRLAYGDSDRWWWRVQAVSEHFAAAVHQAPFRSAGTLYYTVLDWRNGVRGPCNLIGQSYGDGSYSETECAEMLAEFEHHEVFLAKLQASSGALPSEPTLEISHRNRVPLTVLAVRPAARSAA